MGGPDGAKRTSDPGEPPGSEPSLIVFRTWKKCSVARRPGSLVAAVGDDPDVLGLLHLGEARVGRLLRFPVFLFDRFASDVEVTHSVSVVYKDVDTVNVDRETSAHTLLRPPITHKTPTAYKWIRSLHTATMSGLCPCCGSKNRNKYAKAGAAVGGQVGASAGARLGPFATGFSAGLGGAVGYLAGNAVDAASGDFSAVTPIPDGGRPAHDGVSIPVESESGASQRCDGSSSPQ
jgi:hypothetical protein